VNRYIDRRKKRRLSCGLPFGLEQDKQGEERVAKMDYEQQMSLAQKKRPFQGVNPKMLSSGEFQFSILYITSACSSSFLKVS